MVLTEQQRMEVLARYVMYKNAKQEEVPLNVSDLGVAVDAMDNWLESVKEMLNQSSSPAGNEKLSFKDKMILLVRIIEERLAMQY